MGPENGRPSFLDRGTIIALAIVMIFWIGWSRYMEVKYPPQRAFENSEQIGNQGGDQVALQAQAAKAPTASAVAPSPGAAQRAASQPIANESVVAEKKLNVQYENLAFELSSIGMGLKNIDIRSYKTRAEEPILMGAIENLAPFSTKLVGAQSPLAFSIEQKDATTFFGVAKSGDLTVEKTMRFEPETYSFRTDLKVIDPKGSFKGLEIYLSDILQEAAPSSFFAPSFDFQDFLAVHDGGSRTQHIIVKKDGLTATHENVTLASLSSHYFTMAIVDQSPLLPRFSTLVPAQAEQAVGVLSYVPVNARNEFEFKYTAYVGPKSLNILSKVDPQLSTVINFGMFAWIAKPLLWLLKFLNEFLHNFGWSIVVLTIIVRILVLPFNVYSYRSMKAMQLIQPEMQRLRERYKDDPQTMNKAVMDLMRAHKVNPLGGCLPMLLQLPVFIALYQVLGQSIELYRAPYMLWIQDLSVKDPYYVLPVLMAITMYVQQKITPTTMPPEQQRILQWLPVIFAFFMLSLPSGLTLYIFVSTLFGIVQQYVFMREKSPSGASISTAQAVEDSK